MKRLNKIKEEIAMTASSPPIAGLPPDIPAVPAGVTTSGRMLRRKKFAGQEVFVVPSDAFHKAKLGKKKFEHYSSYVGREDIGKEITEFARANKDAPIILEDEITGAMVYLRYGKR